MKVKVWVERVVEVEINDPVIEKLIKLHQADPFATGSAEDYETAIHCIEKATGLPVYNDDAILFTDHIFAAYAENDTVIFEC